MGNEGRLDGSPSQARTGVDEGMRIPITQTMAREMATQTDPIKGRSTKQPLPEVGMRHRSFNAPCNDRGIEYISAPYIAGLTEAAQTILTEAGLVCRLMHRQEDNSLYKMLKDVTPVTCRCMVTFAVECCTCGGEIFFNALESTIGQVIERRQKATGESANVCHEIQWAEPRVVMSHTTVNKAQKALEIIYEVIAGENTITHYAPYVRSVRGYTDASRCAIRNAFTMPNRRAGAN